MKKILLACICMLLCISVLFGDAALLCYAAVAGNDPETAAYTAQGVGIFTLRGSFSAGEDPLPPSVIRLWENGEVVLETEVTGDTFTLEQLPAGVYDLEITRASHLPYTLRGIEIFMEDVDLSVHSDPAIAGISLTAGDVNGDGCIDLQDVVLLTSKDTYSKSYEEAATPEADVNGDGSFDLQDLTIITSTDNYGQRAAAVDFVPEATGDAFDTIVNRYAYLEFSNGKYAYQPYQQAILSKINANCRNWMSRVNRSSTTDPFGQNYAFTSKNMSTIYKNILDMARGYATPGSDYHKNEDLREEILYCLDFMYNKFYGGTKNKLPSGSNWHDSYINVPGSLTRILLALREDLSIAQMKHYMDWMDKLIYSPSYTSANMIDMTFAIILASALEKDGTRLQKAVSTLSGEVFDYVTSGDGIYRDGSYILHSYIPYTTGYGGSLLDNLSSILYTVAGTPYTFSDTLINRQVDWIFDSFVPVLFRGAAMSAVNGRLVWSNASESARSVCVITGMARICQYAPPARAAEIKALLKHYLSANPYPYGSSDRLSTADFITAIERDTTITANESQISAKVFPYMARVSTHRGDFASMLSMCSPSIARYECFLWSETNRENPNGWYTGAGMLYVYADSVTQYDQAFHRYADHYRLPGTTVDTRERNPLNNAGTFNQSAFVGGVQMDEFAMAAFQYDNKNGDFQSDLVAKKSYFFFDDEYVMLGTDINSSLDQGVITTVENQKVVGGTGNLYLNDNTSSVSAAADTVVSGVKYAYISGYGSLIFPQKQTLTVKLAQSSGRVFSEIFFDHGTHPTNDTYSYIILPLSTRAEGKAYSENPDVEILANTKQIQAVREKELGITGIVFWQAGSYAGITPDFPCTMLLRETGSSLRIALSDPTMKLTGKRTVVLDGTYVLTGGDSRVSVSAAGGKTTLTVDMTGAEGQSIEIGLEKN